MMPEVPELIANTYAAVKASMKNYVVASVLFAMVTAMLRITRDNKERSFMRRLQEAVICGCLTLTFSLGLQAALVYMDMPEEKVSTLLYCGSIFIGGCIGNLGSTCIRQVARRWATKQIDKLD